MMKMIGIKGIRKIIADNKRGWHVWTDNEYKGYSDYSLSELRTIHNTKYCIDVTGNGLSIVTKL